MPLRRLHPKAGMQRAHILEYSFAYGDFSCRLLNLFDVGVAPRIASLLDAIGGNFTNVGGSTFGEDVRSGHAALLDANTSPAISVMLWSSTSPCIASAMRCDSKAFKSSSARFSSDITGNRRSRAYCLIVLLCKAAAALRAWCCCAVIAFFMG